MSDSREILALEIRAALGTLNDDRKPLVPLIHDLVAKAKQAEAVEAIKVMTWRENDVVVVKAKTKLSQENIVSLRKAFESIFVGTGKPPKIAVIDSGMDVEIIRRDEAASPKGA